MAALPDGRFRLSWSTLLFPMKPAQLLPAVELIGRDGTRQWAKTAAASSSFGDRSPNLNFSGRQPAAGK